MNKLMNQIIKLERSPISYPVLEIENAYYIVVVDNKNKLVLHYCDEEGTLTEKKHYVKAICSICKKAILTKSYYKHMDQHDKKGEIEY